MTELFQCGVCGRVTKDVTEMEQHIEEDHLSRAVEMFWDRYVTRGFTELDKKLWMLVGAVGSALAEKKIQDPWVEEIYNKIQELEEKESEDLHRRIKERE